MAYSTAKLSLVLSTVEGQGPQLWSLINSDSLATMLGAGYVTDATKLGMRVGDIVLTQTGTFDTTVYTAPTTKAVGDNADFTDTPPVWMWAQCGSITTGAATLLTKQQIGGTGGYLGFYGAAPIVQPTATAQSSGASTTITSVGSTSLTALDVTRINAAFARIEEVRVLTDAIRTALVNEGLIKGA